MKQFRLVFAVGIPVALAVGGWLVLRSLSGPATGPAVVPTRSADGRTEERPRTVKPIPPSEWPRVEAPTGNAAKVPGTRVVPDVNEGEMLTPDLLEKLLAEGTSEAWSRIRELLAEGSVTDPDAAATLLVKALGKGGNAATYAMGTLPLLKDEGARDRACRELLDLAGRTRDRQTLSAAFEAIGQLGDETAVEPLAAFARNLTDRAAVTQAVYAIAGIGGPESARELARLLAEKQGTPVADAVMTAIGRVKTPEMVDQLRPLLGSANDPALRLAATRALGLTRAGEAVAPLQAIAAAEGDPTLRAAAVEGLGHIGTKDAVEELLRIRKSGGDMAHSAGIAIGLATVSDPAAKVLLRELDEESDVRVRVSMIRALEGSGAEGVKEKLGAYLASSDEPEAVRSYSARSLGGTADPKVVAPLTDALRNATEGERDLRTSILRAFMNLAKAPAAKEAMREKTLPMLEEMMETRTDDPNRFWMQRLINELQR